MYAVEVGSEFVGNFGWGHLSGDGVEDGLAEAVEPWDVCVVAHGPKDRQVRPLFGFSEVHEVWGSSQKVDPSG